MAAWLRGQYDRARAGRTRDALEDRAADTGKPLIVVADLAGGNWAERGRRAALALNAAGKATPSTPTGLRLLIDCRAVFGDLDAIRARCCWNG